MRVSDQLARVQAEVATLGRLLDQEQGCLLQELGKRIQEIVLNS